MHEVTVVGVVNDVYWHCVVWPELLGVVVTVQDDALAKADVTRVWHCVV